MSLETLSLKVSFLILKISTLVDEYYWSQLLHIDLHIPRTWDHNYAFYFLLNMTCSITNPTERKWEIKRNNKAPSIHILPPLSNFLVFIQ